MSIVLRGQLYDLSETPLVMGILNHTPDSFYAGSRLTDETKLRERVRQIVEEGGDIIDVGGYSTRPGAAEVTAEEEWRRVSEALSVIREEAPDTPVSVDTFRADVARKAVEAGADIINDVSGGKIDPAMLPTVAELQVPYILMHMRGTPQTMKTLTDYRTGEVTEQVIEELLPIIRELKDLGFRDELIILDPGYGFSKTLEQNFELLAGIDKFKALGYPLLIGISRKDFIYKNINATPHEALNGTTVLNTFSLLHGADIIRVHDVRAAKEAVLFTGKLKKYL